MNDLIPECIATWHDNYMIRLVETGVSKIIRKYRVAIAKNKGKIRFKISLIIKVIFNSFFGLTFMCVCAFINRWIHIPHKYLRELLLAYPQ